MLTNTIGQLQELKAKAELNKHIHFSIFRRASRLKSLLHSLILIGSCTVAILTFADVKIFLSWIPTLSDSNYRLATGTFAGLVFILTILEEYLRLDAKAVSHEAVGKQLTSYIRKIRKQEEIEEISKEDIEKFINEYISIFENAPVISDKVFLKEKRNHKIKKDISDKINKTPYMNITFYIIRMRLEQYCGKNKNGETHINLHK